MIGFSSLENIFEWARKIKFVMYSQFNFQTSDPQTPSAAAAPTTPSAQPLSQLMLTRMTTQSAVMSAAGSQMVLHPAAGSQVVLQPAGQQLVAAAGQHLLSSSGGIALANTSIAGLDIRQAMAPGTILTSVTSHLVS